MKNVSEFSEALKHEPNLASPAELDEKILGYAKQHAPQASFSFGASWQGLASACVVVVSVWFVLQQPDELSTGPAMPSPQMAMPEASAVAADMAEVSLYEAAPMELESAVVVEARSQRVMARKSSVAKEMRLEKKQEIASFAFNDNMSEQFEEELELELDRIIQLWIKDGRPTADAAYKTLMAKCTDCDWPENLEEAVLEQRGEQSYKQLQLLLSEPKASLKHKIENP